MTDVDGSGMAEDSGEPRHGFARRYARFILKARWLVVLVWLVGAGAATMSLPLPTTGGQDLGGLVPRNSSAVQAQARSLTHFDVPLLTSTAVVLHNPDGLPVLSQADVVLHALAVDQRLRSRQGSLPDNRVLGALPLLNTAGVVPGSHDTGTTAVTYLYFSPNTSINTRTRLAHEYAKHFQATPGTRIAVTGTAPARTAESRLLTGHLNLVEIVTLAFVALVVAVIFRSVVAPLALLAAAFLAYLVGIRLLGLLGQHAALTLPSELEPLIVALVLGIMTDYAVFFLTGIRDRLRDGRAPHEAFVLSVRRNVPIVAVAGLTVAAGTMSLYAAQLQLFRSFGPGLALSVVVGALAAITFLPAVMAIVGDRIYWPSHPQRPGERRSRDRRPSWLVRFASHRVGAAVVCAVCVGGLAAAAYPLLHLRLDLSFIQSLPHDSEAQQGADLVAQGFPKGVLAPTVLLVSGPGVTQQNAALTALRHRLERQPEVAGVLGPGSLPVPGDVQLFRSPDTNEARYLLYFRNSPLGGNAVHDLRRLQGALPTALDHVGLEHAQFALAGNTAIASETAHQTIRNLWIIFGVAFALEFVILALFLRALIAPLVLLSASALVVGAALGLTTLVFQESLHRDGLAFYVPFATSVLLISLGSDYNVFGVGRIWDEAEGHRLKRAIRTAMPETSRAITTAGLILAGSFAVVALIPLSTFREMAFTMVVGLVLDTFVVRSILTPGLLTLIGPVSGWPGHRLLARRQQEAQVHRQWERSQL